MALMFSRLCCVPYEVAIVITSFTEQWERPTSITDMLSNFEEHSPSSEGRNRLHYWKVSHILENSNSAVMFTRFRL
jgi:hypothetical protein